jgi:hypothetical protein
LLKLQICFVGAAGRAKRETQVIMTLGIGWGGVDLPGQLVNRIGGLLFLKQTDAEELVERGHARQNDERVANGGKGLVILTILHARNNKLEFRRCVFRKNAQRLVSFGVVRPEFQRAAGLGFGSDAVGDEQEICGVGQMERGGVRSEKQTTAITPARQECLA